MFIRTKSRKNASGKTYSYAYLVSNKYRKKGPKQSIKKYLGRVYPIEKTQNNVFSEHFSDVSHSKKPFKNAILELLRLELSNHGFIAADQHPLIFAKDNIIVDLPNSRVFNTLGKPVYLALNDGYLGNFTLSKILKYKPPETIDKAIGKDLAKKLISAGIFLDSNTFLALFDIVKQSLKK